MKLQKLFQFILLFVAFLPAKAQTSVPLWVNETKSLEINPPTGFISASWTKNPSNAPLTMSSTTGTYTKITPTSYFNGSVTVTCTYKYSLYYGDKPSTVTSTWLVSCRDNPLVLYPSQMELEVGSTASLSPSVTYTNSYSSTHTYSYSSYDQSIISVSSSGVVKALSAGTTNIVVTCNLSANQEICKVTVKPSVSVSLNKTSVSVDPGETISLSASTDKYYSGSYSWSSSSPSIASVEGNGSEAEITASKTGSTTITVTLDNGSTATCKVTVNRILPSQITLSPSPLKLSAGYTKSLAVSYEPEGASASSIIWKSEDTSVATVSSSGVVKGISEGTTQVTATTDNGITASAEVIVLPEPSTISLKDSETIYLGFKKTLTPTFIPDDSESDLTWSSANTSIATVSTTGVVTGKKVGSTTINAVTRNGLKAQCDVNVQNPPSGITTSKISTKITKFKNIVSKILK